jgi:hypothetical protein
MYKTTKKIEMIGQTHAVCGREQKKKKKKKHKQCNDEKGI